MDFSLTNNSLLVSLLMLSSVSFAESEFIDTEQFQGQISTIKATDVHGSTANVSPIVEDDPSHFLASLASLKEVGRGEMEWWWFTLYRARLLTANGVYNQGMYPLILEIEYYQDIPSERLVEATLDQWEHLNLDDNRQQQWQTTISALWPDVVEGDKLSLKVTNAQVSQFYFNGKPLSKAMPAGFSDDFLAIWLSDQTSRPSLKKQLLGEVACDC